MTTRYLVLRRAKDASKALVQTLALAHAINETAFEVTACVGPSMLPTFNQWGDVVLVDRTPFVPTMCCFANGNNGVGKGDVVVSRSPTNPKHMVCKRVVAVGGERVEKKASASESRGRREEEVDGWSGYRKWDEKGADFYDDDDDDDTAGVETNNNNNKATSRQTNAKKKTEYVTVPDGHVWLQGDNERNSTDSRDYGPVPMEMLRGRVFAKVWPIGERKWVQRDERYGLRDEREPKKKERKIGDRV
tara:strand:- start:14 stop:754 length:741 start_codon:yes stop_codon:yes gene_type:complete